MAETQSGGIIFPPPDIRGVIDTTAQFVAKHGKSFEERVQREQSSAKSRRAAGQAERSC